MSNSTSGNAASSFPGARLVTIPGLPAGRVYAVSDRLWNELIQMSGAEIDAEVSSGRLAERIKGRAVVMDMKLDDPASDADDPDSSSDSPSSPASRCSRALGDDFGRGQRDPSES
jgi:hypothetical protein